MAYNSAYTGAQIDEAVGSVRQNGAAWTEKAAKPVFRTLTLPASGWDGSTRTQTVAVDGVSADETKQALTVTPAPDSLADAGAAWVRCSAQGAGTLTFSCNSLPPEKLTYYVTIQEVRT